MTVISVSRNLTLKVLGGLLSLLIIQMGLVSGVVAQAQNKVWSDQEKPIVDQLRGLRQLADDVRGQKNKELALQIRQLPASKNKVALANSLASLSTEGDFGHDSLQEVAATLADALREQPQPDDHGQPAASYMELAQLERYEHIRVSLDASAYKAAMAKLAANDENRARADFTLTDIEGKSWQLKELRGKVVLVNFWATWCPPCRKELPDLEALHERFKDRGLVILGISDETIEKVKPFIAERKISYPVLLDQERKVNELFQVDGIPKTFVFDRDGKLVAQSIDMRTQAQFMQMLSQAGLQ